MPLNRELPEFQNLTKRERELLRMPERKPVDTAIERQAERMKVDRKTLERIKSGKDIGEWE